MNWIYRLVALADSESLCRRWEMGDHMLRTCAVNKLWMLKSLFIGIRLELFIIRSTLRESRPNKASLKCPSMHTYVHPYVHRKSLRFQ